MDIEKGPAWYLQDGGCTWAGTNKDEVISVALCIKCTKGHPHATIANGAFIDITVTFVNIDTLLNYLTSSL